MFFKDEALGEPHGSGVADDRLYQCANCRMVVHGQCYSAKASTVFLAKPTSSESTVTSFSLSARYLAASNPDEPGPSASCAAQPLEWLCERCRDHDDVTIRMATCRLCELRGGALLKVTSSDGERHFVHVVCALIHRRTKFVRPDERTSPFTYPSALICQNADLLSEKLDWGLCLWGTERHRRLRYKHQLLMACVGSGHCRRARQWRLSGWLLNG